MRKKLYVCDGKVPDCKKTACAFNGKGDCMHTADKSHARYEPPREWGFMDCASGTLLVEKVRDGR